MCARVQQAMAQFVLKIEKWSHIMETAPIAELARTYGLHPRLWLLIAGFGSVVKQDGGPEKGVLTRPAIVSRGVSRGSK